MDLGFLFDIDGTLSYIRGIVSILRTVVPYLFKFLNEQKYPYSIITGRSCWWVKHFFSQNNLNKIINAPIACEYGSITYNITKDYKKYNIKNNEDLTVFRKELIYSLPNNMSLIKSYTKPHFRCLWEEPKDYIMTLRPIPDLNMPIEKIVEIVEPVFYDFRTKLTLNVSDIAIDIIPKNIDKSFAATNVLKNLKNKDKVKTWIALGDTESDKKMINNLTNAKFLKIDPYNPEDLEKKLSSLNIIFNK